MDVELIISPVTICAIVEAASFFYGKKVKYISFLKNS